MARDNTDLIGKGFFYSGMNFRVLRVDEDAKCVVVLNETGGFECHLEGKFVRHILRYQKGD